VRGTTRSPERTEAIAAAGAEPYIGDPDRVGTLMGALSGVTVVAWLLAGAEGERAAELHAGRLRMLCEKLVDTHVRGLVYEAAGSLPGDVLAGGAEIVERAHATWSIPVEILRTDPAECREWTSGALAAVDRLLTG
jgi:hypothetical protein